MSVILSILVFTKRDQDLLKEWLIPDLEQKIYKMILAYFSCPKARKLKSNGLGKLNHTRNNIRTSSKESTCQSRRCKSAGSIPGSGRSPGEGNGNPLQCSCLENSIGRGAWQATVHGASKNRTQLSIHTQSNNIMSNYHQILNDVKFLISIQLFCVFLF